MFWGSSLCEIFVLSLSSSLPLTFLRVKFNTNLQAQTVDCSTPLLAQLLLGVLCLIGKAIWTVEQTNWVMTFGLEATYKISGRLGLTFPRQSQ